VTIADFGLRFERLKYDKSRPASRLNYQQNIKVDKDKLTAALQTLGKDAGKDFSEVGTWFSSSQFLTEHLDRLETLLFPIVGIVMRSVWKHSHWRQFRHSSCPV